MRMLDDIPVATLITHRFPIQQAARAYELLHENPAEVTQVLLTYDQLTRGRHQYPANNRRSDC